jgi:hypothetical protein
MFGRLTSVERTAYHEAGHAVAAFLLKRPFLYISIVPDSESLGRVTYPDTYWNGFVPNAARIESRLRLEEEIIKVLAGEAAEGLFAHRLRRRPREHRPRAIQLARAACQSEGELRAYITWLWERGVSLINEPSHRAAVEALALALLEKKEIPYCPAIQIMKDAIRKFKRGEKYQSLKQQSGFASS